MAPSKRSLLRAAQWILIIAVLAFATAELSRQWDAVRAAVATAELKWVPVLTSCALVLVSYVMLVEAWRRTVAGLGGSIGYLDAATIWFISNLGKYVPGKVWQLGSLALLARERGVPPMAAAGAALVVTMINTVAGFGVVALTGVTVLDLPVLAVIAIVVIGALLMLSPHIVPRLASVLARVIGRDIPVRAPTAGSLWYAAAASTASWLLYGIAFYLLALGVGIQPAGAPAAYVAVFAGSYLLGFLAIFAPGGVGVREVVMAAALTKVGMPQGPAILLVLASRLWLTLLELIPALAFLVHYRLRYRPQHG
ncbi:MAG TPA: lysylphosphatidylglycerol synthase domain-containing protein [Gemmatimonadaceae bacterium]|nr:lysylphosphatidylglycerol synthase domain-containing protein [Gemmatimonadaceae bacterium]